MNIIVYLLKLEMPLDDKMFHFLMSFSPTEKKKRILSQRVKQNADNMVIGGALVRYMLWKEFGISVNAEISYGDFGKPYLHDYPRVYFNLSHSGKFVVCAVADVSIGIDIQEIVTYSPEICKRICTQDEILRIRMSSNPDKEFSKIWAKKEAYLKLIGCGITGEVKQMFPKENVKFISICVENIVGYLCYSLEI